MKKSKQHIRKSNKITLILPIISIIGIGSIFITSMFYQKSWFYNWNGIRQQIKDTIKIAQNGYISGRSVGDGGFRPAQYDRRIWIMKNATESELLKLTEYPNGTIKTIAYEGLLRKPNFADKNKIVLKAISETEYFTNYESGCFITYMTIGEYIVDYILQIGDLSPPPPPGDFWSKFGLSEKEHSEILVEYRKAPGLLRENTLHNKVYN